MVKTALVIGLISFATAWVLICWLRPWAFRIGLLDYPDGRRKQHLQPTPLLGGIAVLLAMSLAALAGLAFWPPESGEGLHFPGLLLAGTLVCGVGVVDDRWRLRGRHKVLGQLVAVAIAIASGVVVHKIALFGWTLDLGFLAIPLTAFWLLGAINACNLLDGLDGFLATIAAVACLGMAGVALATGHGVVALAAMALLGALLAFLCFNFPPASVYFGDAGSMLVGLVLGVLTLRVSRVETHTVAVVGPLILLTLPILDTLAAILRRALTGRSLYTTDRGHIHHWLLRQGSTPRQVVGIAAGLSLVCVLGLVASRVFHNDLLGLGAGLGVLIFLVGGRGFGLAEAQLVKERLRGLWFHALGQGPSRPVRQIQVRLQGSLDWAGLWQTAAEDAARTGLVGLVLDVNAPALQEGFHARWQRPVDECEMKGWWRTEMPLMVAGQCIGRIEISAGRDQLLAQESFQHLLAMAQAVESAVAQLLASGCPADDPEAPTPIPKAAFPTESKRTALYQVGH